MSGNGLNLNATTTISPLFSATNNGADNVGFYIAPNVDDNTNVSLDGGAIENTVNNSGGTIHFTFTDANGNSILGADNDVDLESGSTTRVGLKIDTNGLSDTGSITDSMLLSTIDIVADTAEYNDTS